MTKNEVDQQRWNDSIEKLRLRFNLSDQEVVTIKEWGIALLITGASVWVLYRIVRTILGFSSKKTVKVKVEAPHKKRRAERERKQEPEDQAPPPRPRPAKSTSAYRSSPWFPLIRRYAGPLLVALARQQVMRYLRANQIIR